MNDLIQKSIPIVAFCSPGPAHQNLPCKIVDSSYKYLKELGVDILLGQDEVYGVNDELDALVFKALDYCKKYDIKYLARLEINREFVSLPDCSRKPYYKAFCELDSQEKNDLKKRFLKILRPIMEHEACYGVAFQDEPGLEMLPGVKFAKDIFKEAYPNKTFYINNICCLANDSIYYFGQYNGLVKDNKTQNSIFPKVNGANRFERYQIFMDKFYEFVPDDDVYSYDAYAIQNLAGSECSVNKSLYDMPYFVNKVCLEKGKRFWNFIQLSKFDELTRVPTYNEFLLQINISLALGSKGIELFPTCYPNDFYGFKLFSGSPLDEYGNKHSTFEPLRKAIEETKLIRKSLSLDKAIGFKLFGNFKDFECYGLKQGDTRILEKENGDAAFNGSLEWSFNEDALNDVKIECENQVAAGYFENNKYLFVNNSTRFKDNLLIKFKKEYNFEVFRKNQLTKITSNGINVDNLEPGEGLLITIIKGEQNYEKE